MACRYAVYFSPGRDHALFDTGNRWLARPPSDAPGAPPVGVPGIAPDRLEEITDSPRRYGFHGTLKAPFRLAHGVDEAQLVDAACAFAAKAGGFMLPGLSVATLGDFIALVPSEPSAELHETANACVTFFEAYRAPLSEAEIARRRPDRLTGPQLANLGRWGYPYVFDEFRFHMTLTGPVTAAEKAALLPFLDRYFATALAFPVEFDAITLFRQPDTDAPFEILTRISFSRLNARAG